MNMHIVATPIRRSLITAPTAIFPVVLFIFALITGGVSRLHAAVGGVTDNGGFFSAQAKAQAAEVIRELSMTGKQDLTIETFKEVPLEMRSGANLQDKAQRQAFFSQWANRQFKEKGMNGVYVLLVKEPPHLQVAVGNNTQRAAFTTRDRDALVSLMTAKLREKQNDDALREGVNFVSATMKSRAGSAAKTGNTPESAVTESSETTAGSGSGILQVLVVAVVIWIVIGLFRALSGRMGGAGASQAGATGGGGGFFSSLMGGLFGAAAGMWMYNSFFGGQSHAAESNDSSASQDNGDTGGYTHDTDSDSSGGDFGGDGGGGDYGGDSGGGDF